ncbi:MAG: protein phosphatase 2C domain-containing protein [Tissierellia bacterium]|nr:protein phosphatase 2C domain-containing protein [Tissierellia bacterium]
MNYFAKSEIGCARKNNEDSFLVREMGANTIYLICDGMGGHSSGEVASQMAVQFTQTWNPDMTQIRKADVQEILKKLVEDINIRIYLKSKSAEQYNGMGTTFSLAMLHKKNIHIAHIGDSRIYGLGKTIELLTQDHTYLSELKKRGVEIEEDKVRDYRKYITRAMGTSTIERPDLMIYPKKAYEYLFMCTDGVTNHLSDEEIFQMYATRLDDKTFVDQIVNACLERGGKDNITCIFAEIGE